MDAETNTSLSPPTRFVDSPRRYGFHATLKAPMRLAKGVSYRQFSNAVESLAQKLQPVELGILQPGRIGNFLALGVEPAFHPKVAGLAWQCVRALDPLRAALNEHERNKRNNLSTLEQHNLENWGYPYVGEAFRFHMTLTSALDEAGLKEAENRLAGKIPTDNMMIDALCIFGDPGANRPFSLLERFALKG